MNTQRYLKIVPLAVQTTAQRTAVANNPKRIVIDFSSPNIAKPFHFGHLKSTILGNFLANLNKYYGHHVTKLNYIGDWGTQYGLLSLGLESSELQLDKKIELKKLGLQKLLDIYVAANAKGTQDENFYQKARDRFKSMDIGEDLELLSRWQQVRDVSLDELRNSYKQLGIHFDVYEFESDHAKASHKLVEEMRNLGHISENEDGVLVTEVIKNDRVVRVPMLKSDNSSLYMTRDVAAALHRKEKYHFDKMFYVVGADQEKHFHCLREIVNRLGHNWSNELIHVKMGKIKGMSSRSGDAILLSKIIEEATRSYEQSTKEVPTSRVTGEPDIKIVAQQLALSALYVYDMRNKRTRNYDFDWKQVMVAGERSGIHLQTTYARLNALKDRARLERRLEPYDSSEEINYDALNCANGILLIEALNKLGQSLQQSYESLDPSPLVNHALFLCREINRARRCDMLHVLHENIEVEARSRLSLFENARLQLDFIIRMIGLQPLERV